MLQPIAMFLGGHAVSVQLAHRGPTGQVFSQTLTNPEGKEACVSWTEDWTFFLQLELMGYLHQASVQLTQYLLAFSVCQRLGVSSGGCYINWCWGLFLV